MSTMHTCTYNLEDIGSAVEFILEQAGMRKKIAFFGEVGAGKTTLTQALCRRLGAQDTAVSPTFALVNEYLNPSTGLRIHHVDLYRLRSIEEALDIGMEDLLYDEHYCFVEWPELIEPLLPEDVVRIKIEEIGDLVRKIIIL